MHGYFHEGNKDDYCAAFTTKSSLHIHKQYWLSGGGLNVGFGAEVRVMGMRWVGEEVWVFPCIVELSLFKYVRLLHDL